MARIRRHAALFLACLALAACTKKNPDFCANSTECPTGSVCNLELNACEPEADAGGSAPDAAADAECTLATDCQNPEAPICDPDDLVCRACDTDTECEDKDPLAPACAADGRCVECTSHDHCESRVCDEESCLPEQAVIYMSPSGSSSSVCGTLATPCTDMEDSITHVTSTRKHVFMMPGSYGGDADTLQITSPVTIIGYGAEFLPSSFDVGVAITGDGPVAIEGLIIRGGGAEVINPQIHNESTLILNEVVIEDGLVDGIRNEGSLIVKKTMVRGHPRYGITGLGDVVLEDSSIMDNERGLRTDIGDVVIRRSTIADNPVMGVQHSYGPLTIEASVIRGNGIGVSAGTAQLFLANTFVFANDVGIDGTGSSGTISFATVTANRSGIESCASVATANSIVYGNTESQLGEACSATYSDIQGGAPGSGNIDAPPEFVDGGNADFHLQPTSPCRDSAEPDAALPVDFDGDTRPAGTRADIGADEIPK